VRALTRTTRRFQRYSPAFCSLFCAAPQASFSKQLEVLLLLLLAAGARPDAHNKALPLLS
jgi:hypothetical protein